MGGGPRVLGRLLVESGVLETAELEAALSEQRGTGARLGEILARRGLDPEQIARALADQLRLGYAAPPLTPTTEVLGLVDRALLLRHQVLPLRLVGRSLEVAVPDPLDLEVLDDLRFQTGLRIEPLVATRAAIEGALAEILGDDPSSGRADGGEGLDEVTLLRRASESAPIVALVDLILQRALELGASDVHIEPVGDRLRVRARVDGLLREILELPGRVAAGIASRLKIMADMDIAVKRRPQDGRSKVRVGTRELLLRVSTLPAQGGEKVVLRLLIGEDAYRRLDDLGFDPADLERFGALLRRGHGVILVTGPTGSGKTTTLYSALAALDRERRNILTLEDPVEYELEGVTQVQIQRRAGLDFASALRAVLRQDPDVIMVGELRDRETVETALAAALTGHLVLSTLHTNDAASAPTRLVEMGAPRYLIASGLIGVLAQRLVRRLCTECKEGYEYEPERAWFGRARGVGRLYRARGCLHCDGVGYRGRIGVYELLVIDETVRELIIGGGSTDALRDLGRERVMTTLGQDAWTKVVAGITTVEEVEPLVALMEEEVPHCSGCGAVSRRDFNFCPLCGRGHRVGCSCGRWLEDSWKWCPSCGVERGCGRGVRLDREG